MRRRSRTQTSCASALAGCVAVLVSAWLAPREARACGVSAGGVPGVCSVSAHDAALAQGKAGASQRFRASAAVTRTVTSIDFSSGAHADSERTAITGGFDWRPSNKVTLTLTGGALVTGSLTSQTGAHSMLPGPLVAVTVSWRVVDQPQGEKGYGRPFVLFSLTGAGLFTQTEGPSSKQKGAPLVRTPYTAFDLRFAAVVGTTLGRIATPYAVGRLFGGPIFWNETGQSVTGTDTYKHQLGLGLAVRLGPVDLFVEGVPVGERALTGGGGISF